MRRATSGKCVSFTYGLARRLTRPRTPCGVAALVAHPRPHRTGHPLRSAASASFTYRLVRRARRLFCDQCRTRDARGRGPTTLRLVPMADGILADLVHAASQRGATYADARWVERENETISVRDGGVEAVTRAADRGVGFRVIHNGAWGFAATDRTGEAAMKQLVDEAFRRAEASASTRTKPVTLAPIAPQKGEYRTTLARDPFAVPAKERIALLLEADAALKGPNAKSRRASVAAYRTRKRLVTSEGTDVSQEVVESGAGVAVTAAKGGAKPAQRYDSRLTRQAGWEFIEELDLVARAKRYREDAEATLDAPLAAEKPTTLVFAPEFLALLVHESCGHPTEADRVLEYEV